jgi:hypothetical protein
MRLKRFLAVTGAAAFAASGLAFVTAPAASAEDIEISVDCSQEYLLSGAQLLAVQPGTSITINFGNAQGECDDYLVLATTTEEYAYVFEDGYPDGYGSDFPTAPFYTWTIKPLPPGGVIGGPDDPVLQVFTSIATCGPGNNTSCGAEFYLIIGTNIGGSPGSTPPDWQQSYARASQDEECKPGWNPSWDYWPNGGTGGWVCNRSVPFTSSAAAAQP